MSREPSASTSSSSSSPQCLSVSIPINCQVCHNTAQGTHFGVHSCRACAAFFRRTIVLKLKYFCKNADKHCRINSNQLYNCRYCRYAKCERVGMIPDNVQWNRDASSSTVQRKRTHPDEEPIFPIIDRRLLPGWRKHEKKPAVFDLTNLFRRIKRTFSKFKEPTDTLYAQSNTLAKMDWVLRNRENTNGNGTIEINNNFGFQKIIQGNGSLIKRAAEWMMHSEEFRGLCPAEKFQVFMETWQIWDRLCKVQLECKVFGRRVLDEKLHMVSPNEACQMDKVSVDFSLISKRPNQELQTMLSPLAGLIFDDVIKPFLELEPSSMETTYLLCNATFSVASKKFPESISSVCDRFLEKVSNDLHEYYAQKQEINYAPRLLKLLGIVKSLHKVFQERKKILELAELFDVINSNVCEPNFFMC